MNIIWFLFSFKGRIQRLHYWLFTLVMLIIILVPAYVLFESFSEEANNFVNLMSLIFLWPNLAVQAKRWHDRNKSAFWLLINFVPFIGTLWAIIENGFLAGTTDTNRYGEVYGTVAENQI